MSRFSRSSAELESSEALALERLTFWLAPYRDRIGRDYERYFNHCARVMLLSRKILSKMSHQGWPQIAWDPELFSAAAAFHDLGLWTRWDWDYLPPSIEELQSQLSASGATEETVTHTAKLVDFHHRVRSLPLGQAWASTEAFRRADVCEVTLGWMRFGVDRSEIVRLLHLFPRKGFIWMLVRRFLHRMVTKPWSPVPMFRW